MLELWVAPILTPNAKVLEVGCAAGDFSHSLAERGINVWAVDRSPRMIAKGRKTPSAVQFEEANATSLPFPDQYFDVVVAASLINIVASPITVLNEMRRVCRKGGMISVLTLAHAFSNADAKRYRDERRLTGLSAAAFMIWHRLGRKMEAKVLHDYFKECGMTNISSQYFLDGMVVAIYGQVSSTQAEATTVQKFE